MKKITLLSIFGLTLCLFTSAAIAGKGCGGCAGGDDKESKDSTEEKAQG